MYIGSLPPVSNKETYSQSFTVIDEETGTGFDITNATIVYEIRDPQSQTTELTATISLAAATSGIFTASLTETQMNGLDAKEYDVGCTVTISSTVSQFFVATQVVMDGKVT